jgi:soluble lytic murein transglycosylase-like protein
MVTAIPTVYSGLFMAYNAGPKRYTEHLETRQTLPGETRAYVAKVAGVFLRALKDSR